MLPGWESTEATSPEGLCRGKLKPWAGAIVSVYLTPFFFCGFQNMQLVFSLRVRDDRVKEVQTNFLIMYAIIPEMGVYEVWLCGYQILPSGLILYTAAFKFKDTMPCTVGLCSTVFSFSLLNMLSPIEIIWKSLINQKAFHIANQSMGSLWTMDNTLFFIDWGS